jgi:cellulose synthase/poly-beta-1,6-N-acetylglucosamine synthase-like glycosyltransferase
LKFSIIIPAHNEENFIGKMLHSLVNQTLLPNEVIVVDDNSTDNTFNIINSYKEKYSFISILKTSSSDNHIPGQKVIKAFYKGYDSLNKNYDIICKFDADIILPNNYLERIASIFELDEKVGVAGGLAYIKKDNDWVFESISSKNHVRGPFKAYRKACFKEIGGLKQTIGWDSIDVLLAQYFGWKVITDKKLHVKHLKPTGKTYHKNAKYLQGEALYKMRLGFILSTLSTLKSALSKRDFNYFRDAITGYFRAKKENIPYLVNKNQGKFIRKLRWRGILNIFKLNLRFS